jgi:hypothetical protein
MIIGHYEFFLFTMSKMRLGSNESPVHQVLCASSPKPNGSSPCSQEHQSLSWAIWIQSTHPQPISLRSTLIPSAPQSSKWSLSFRLSHQNLVLDDKQSYLYILIMILYNNNKVWYPLSKMLCSPKVFEFQGVMSGRLWEGSSMIHRSHCAAVTYNHAPTCAGLELNICVSSSRDSDVYIYAPFPTLPSSSHLIWCLI